MLPGPIYEAEEVLAQVVTFARRNSLWTEAYEAAWLLTQLFLRKSDCDRAERWYCDCVTWSERTSEELVQSSTSGLGATLRLAQDNLEEAWTRVLESREVRGWQA